MMPLRESSRPPRTSVRFSTSAAAGWSLALVVIQAVAAGVVRPAGSVGPIDFVSFGLVTLLALFVVLFAVVRVHGPDASLREVVGIDESPLAFPPAVPPGMVWGHRVAVIVCLLVAGLALVVVDGAIDRYFAARDAAFADELAKLNSLLEAPTLRAKIGRILGLGIVEPCAELAFYFGIVFGGLRRPRSRNIACMMALVFFALHASDIRAAPVRLLLAAPMLLGRMATGTIVASALTAVAYNVLAVLAVGRSSSGIPGPTTLWAALLALAIGGLALLVHFASKWRLGEFSDRLDLRA